MDFELRRAREKLEKEQKERKAKAKLKLESSRKAKEEVRRQREALEAVQRQRRLDAAEAEAMVRFYLSLTIHMLYLYDLLIFSELKIVEYEFCSYVF